MLGFSDIIRKMISSKKGEHTTIWGKIVGKLTEILLIVISISIALLVEGWAERQHDHKRLNQYYVSFISEANEDMKSLQDVKTDATKHINNCNRNLKILAQENAPYDSVEYYFVRMYSSNLFANSQMVSYKSMLASGDMHLMENLEMRKALVGLDDSYFAIKISEDMYLKFLTDDLTNFVSTNFDMTTLEPLEKNFYKGTKFKNLVVLFQGLNQSRLIKYQESEEKVKEALKLLEKTTKK
jgi:hypothetical protein